jgi:hypothetical protein
MLLAVAGNIAACAFHLLAARSVREDIARVQRSA